MQIPSVVHRHHFLVKINKEAQRRKREQLAEGSQLVAHVNHVFLRRNQQCGEIVAIGSSPYPAPFITHKPDMDGNRVRLEEPYYDYSAAEYIPEADTGDTLLFHHSIEGSLDDRGGDAQQAYNNSRHLLLEDEEFRYYLVHKSQTYAVDKADGSGIFMAPDWLFCRLQAEDAPEATVNDQGRKLVETASGILLFENYQATADEKKQELKRLEADIQSLVKSGVDEREDQSREQNKRAAEVRTAIQEKMTEMQSISRTLTARNTKAYTPLFPNKTFSRDCGATIDSSWTVVYFQVGEDVVSLEYKGETYSILKTSQVLYVQP